MVHSRQDGGDVPMSQFRSRRMQAWEDAIGTPSWLSRSSIERLVNYFQGQFIEVTADRQEAIFCRVADRPMATYGVVTRLELGIGSRMDSEIDVMHLGNFPKLEGCDHIYLGQGFLDIVVIVAKLPQLTTLRLNNLTLADGSCAMIAKAVVSGYLPGLRSLDLAYCDPGIGGHLTLPKCMESGHMLALEELSLGGTAMGDAGCAAYAAAISAGQLPSLARIWFFSNGIADSGAQALGRAIMQIRGLESLDLSGNNIGDKGLTALAYSFQVGREDNVFPKFRHLELSFNSFGEAGLLSLAKSLSSDSLHSLESLLLSGRDQKISISKECATALVSALSSVKNLIEVSSPLGRFPALVRIQNQNIESNKRMRAFLRKLEGSPMVPATHSKVYICGDPEVGKTTLRKTLQRRGSSWMKNIMERIPHQEQRTRGIEVSMVTSEGNYGQEPIYLHVWDMAGQPEYRLLQNSFFPALKSAKGTATSFIVVCSSQTSRVEFEDQLKCWLQFIASSCGNTTGNPRHVLVVVNNIGGDSKAMALEPNWKQITLNQRQVFKDCLDINETPFIVDVRLYDSVQDLRRSLFDHAVHSLKDETVPEICQFIESNLSAWSKVREQFPVLEWNDFVREIHQQSGEPWPEETLNAATMYLNEAGVLIDINAPSDDVNPHRRLVVLDPNWFCRDIAGDMFLQPGDKVNTKKAPFRNCVDKLNGSISMSDFKAFIRCSAGKLTDLDFTDLIAILLWLGLCYYQGRDRRLYIPALIAESGKPAWELDHTKDQWVMGFTIEQKKSEMTLAPITLWHRFQVELAQASRFNGDQDNAFRNGRYILTFSVDHMSVLIEVTVHQVSPTFDDISIFVKPLRKEDDLDARERKQRQVDLAKELAKVLAQVWDKVCPGVAYLERVVWPWPACQSRPKVSAINMSVADLKKWVEKNGVGKRMQTLVGRESITGDQLLSTKEKQVMGIWKEHGRIGSRGTSLLRCLSVDLLSHCLRLIRQVLAFFDDRRDLGWRILKLTEENNLMLKEQGKLLEDHRELLHKLQNTVDCFWQDSRRTCPVFIYVEERNLGWWSKNYCLRFACEDDSRHEVKGQQGLDMQNLNDWVRNALPWLKTIATVLLLTANISAHALLPGLGYICPAIAEGCKLWSTDAAKVAIGATLTADQLTQIIEWVRPDVSSYVGQNPQQLYGKNMEAISKLLGKLTSEAFKQKVGLRKVCLNHDHHSSQKIVWICDECFEKYDNDFSTHITEL